MRVSSEKSYGKAIEKIIKKQKLSPQHSPLAHDIGLFHYWQAKVQAREQKYDLARESWLRMIANWALVLEDDEYWQAWSNQRSKIYKFEITQRNVQEAREQLREKLLSDLAAFEHVSGKRLSGNGETPPLDVLFELEVKGLRTLKSLGGFSLGTEYTPAFSCGPLLLQYLDLGTAFREYIASHPVPSDDASDALTRMLRMFGAEALAESKTDAKTWTNLLRYFSHLGVAAILLERSQPQSALAALAALCQHENSSSAFPSARQSVVGNGSLLHCSKKCADFPLCSPAYAAYGNGEALLAEHTLALAIEAHLRIAELAIAAEQADVDAALAAWQQAQALAEENGSTNQIRNAVIEMISGRALALRKRRKFDEAIAFLDSVLEVYQDDQLRGNLAEMLTDFGVKAGNEERWSDAVEHLRRAYQLNPSVPRTRNNFVIALRGYAAQYHAEKNNEQARQLLQEAQRILQAETRADRANPQLKEQLFQVQAELATVNGEEGGLLGLLSGLLATAMGGEDSEEDQVGAVGLELRAASLVAQGKLDEAERAFKQAIEVNPGRKQPLIGLSKVYAQRKNVQGMIETQTRIAEIDPSERFNAQMNIGGLLEDTQNYDRAMEYFQQALRVAEDNEQRSRAHEHIGDVLIAQERFDEARSALDQALRLNPNNRGAQLSRATLQMRRKAHGSETAIASTDAKPKPQDRRKPAAKSPKKGCLLPILVGLLLLVVSLAADVIGLDKALGLGWYQICGASVGLVVLIAGLLIHRAVRKLSSPALETLKQFLIEKELKYNQVLNALMVSFNGEARDSIAIQVRVLNEEMVVLGTPLEKAWVDNATALYNLLRVTYTTDIFKICRDSDGDFMLSAEIPLAILDADALEQLIRGLVQMVDLSPIAMQSLNTLQSRAQQVQMRAALDTLFSGIGGGEDVSVRLPALAQRAGVKLMPLGENRFRFTLGGPMNLHVQAHCRDRSVSFIGLIGDARPGKGNLPYYRRAAEMNMAMNVCKIALDSDDDVAFMYELPALDEDSFREMLKRMEQYLVRFGMELALLARA